MCEAKEKNVRNLFRNMISVDEFNRFLHLPCIRAHILYTKIVYFYWFFPCSTSSSTALCRAVYILCVLQMSTSFFISIQAKNCRRRKKTHRHTILADYNTPKEKKWNKNRNNTQDIIVYECFIFVQTLTHASRRNRNLKSRLLPSQAKHSTVFEAHKVTQENTGLIALMLLLLPLRRGSRKILVLARSIYVKQ